MALFALALWGVGPVRADAQSYDYIMYQCYPYTDYYTVTHGNHTFQKPYTTIYCLRYTYTLTVGATPGVGSAVAVSPLPNQSGQYNVNPYGYYGSYGYYNPYSYYQTGTSFTTVTLTGEKIVTKDQSTRYVFVSWIIDGSETSGSNVQTVTMDRSHSVIARYKSQYMLHVSVEPAVASLQGEGWYDSDRTVDLSVPPMVQVEGQGKRYVLAGWDVDGASIGGPSLSVQMNGPHAVKAVYGTQYYLKAGSDYGQVTGDGWYDENSVATVTARSELPVGGIWGALGAKRVFYQWSGDASGSSPTLAIKMDGAKAIVAMYSLDQTMPIVILGTIGIAASLAAIGLLLRNRRIEF